MIEQQIDLNDFEISEDHLQNVAIEFCGVIGAVKTSQGFVRVYFARDEDFSASSLREQFNLAMRSYAKILRA